MNSLKKNTKGFYIASTSVACISLIRNHTHLRANCSDVFHCKSMHAAWNASSLLLCLRGRNKQYHQVLYNKSLAFPQNCKKPMMTASYPVSQCLMRTKLITSVNIQGLQAQLKILTLHALQRRKIIHLAFEQMKHYGLKVSDWKK